MATLMKGITCFLLCAWLLWSQAYISGQKAGVSPGCERFTNLELARFLEWEINSVTPRVKERRDKGILEEHCKRTCNISGRTAICWQVKLKGQIKLL